MKTEPPITVLLSPADVATLLNVSRSHVYVLIEKGKLPHHRIGVGNGAIRVSEMDIREFLSVHRHDSSPAADEKVRSLPRRPLRHLRG